MNIQLIQGEFNPNDARERIGQLGQTKIMYHENKINYDSSEEDIKTREEKIKRLQNELFEIRKFINTKTQSVKVDALIKIE